MGFGLVKLRGPPRWAGPARAWGRQVARSFGIRQALIAIIAVRINWFATRGTGRRIINGHAGLDVRDYAGRDAGQLPDVRSEAHRSVGGVVGFCHRVFGGVAGYDDLVFNVD